MNQQLVSTEGCGRGHRWRPLVGDPVPVSAWHGMRCYCGQRILTLKTCDLGHEHLVEEAR